MQFYLHYVLGLGPQTQQGWVIPPKQKKADRGTAVHKALELLAQQKLAVQQGRAQFVDQELGRTFETSSLTQQQAADAAWEHYVCALPHWEWTGEDRNDHNRWIDAALSFGGGAFDPRRRTVVWPEKRFDLEFDEPWARYRHLLPDGRLLEGRLGLKGTIDLVCLAQGESDVVELVDWKTGQRKDWAKGKVKDYRALRDDPQLRLYHYALSKLCPQAREIIITIFFINDGGPFPLPFGRDDLDRTLDMVRGRFEAIAQCTNPPMAWDDPEQQWKCKRLCEYHMNEWQDSNRSVCRHVKNELVALGMDRVTAKYGGDLSAALRYSGGGGRSAPDSNEQEKR